MYACLVIPLLFLFILNVYCAKILVVFPAPARSHYNLGSALARGLVTKGHDVTMISPYVDKNPPKNGTYRDVVLTGLLEEAKARRKEMNMFDMADTNPFISAGFMMVLMSTITEIMFKHPNVQELIKSGEKFDAVIIEQFLSDGQKALAPHFGGQQILFSTVGANNWINPLVGNPAPPSYIPELFLHYSSNMTFWERLINSLFIVYCQLIEHLYIYPSQNKLVKQYISEDLDLYDILYNPSIVLLNSHPSINQPVPHVPSMIEIGGYHVQPPKKLPEDLQTFLDNAKEGVVYFSMGSNLRTSDLPQEKRDAVLKVFSKLKQKVMWKWEEGELHEKPDNVLIQEWFPQQDILAHKNVKVFITHGGLLSTIEATYHGIPLLAIPIFGDQKINAKIAVNNGIAKMLPYNELNEETLEKNLKELLENGEFGQNAKKRSQIFHDREVKPIDTATYWIEYVIRNKGASHLRVAGVDLQWYKYLLLDVICFVFIVIVILLYINFLVIKKILCRLCQRSKQKIKQN